jgi:hypothetical protein
MAGSLLRILILSAVLAGTSAASAQSTRPWIDPPSEAGAQSRPSTGSVSQDPAPGTKADPKPVAASPSHGPDTPREQTGKTNESLSAEEASGGRPLQSGTKSRPSKKAVAEQGTRSSSRRAAASSRELRRSGAVGSRHEAALSPGIASYRREGGTRGGSRSTRVGRIQGGGNSGLEVMNLRTIEFPDGRRINILTRPDRNTISELMRAPGY